MSVIVSKIFANIVDSMRATGVISNASAPASGIVTITSVNSLVAEAWVTMGDTSYEIQSATDTLFTVRSAVEITAGSWKANAPYYEVGHAKEISNILSVKDKNDNLKYQKYPLIAFFTDVKIKRGDKTIYGILNNQSISIIGRAPNKNASTKERYDDNIEPILYPLHDGFILKMQNSGYFIDVTPSISYDLTERPWWGNSAKYGNVANIFNDQLDALELSNMSIKLRNGIQC